MTSHYTDQPAMKPPEGSVLRNMLRGAGWGLLMRWSMRFIGIFNLMIIARMLTPKEIGVVALATLLSGLLTQFYQIGIPMLLIRKQGIDDADCNTAWTMRMAMGAGIATLMIVFAPSVAGYFDEPRMVSVTYVIALSFFVSSCANIGMVLVRKELDFAKDFRYNVYSRLATFVVTVALVVLLRDAWAIVFGTLCGAIFQVGLSYRMHQYRPKPDLSRYREYLAFSMSIIPINIGQYLVRKSDAWIVGGIAPTERFVAYNMGSDLSSIFTQQVIGSVGRGQFPNYSRLLDQREKLSTAFAHELNVICMLILPLSVGLAVVAEDAVAVLLGDQWGFVVPLLPWLAIYNAMAAIITLMTGQILIATGHEKLSASLIWIRLAIIAPLAYLGGQMSGVEGVAKAVVLATVLAIPIAVWTLAWSKVLSARQFVHAIWRPAVAVIVMALSISWLHMDQWELPLARLIFDACVGGLVFLASLVLLWAASGCPKGPESVVIEQLLALGKNIRGRF